MTDRELLELAAKAAALPVKWEDDHGCYWIVTDLGMPIRTWAPFTDDGDALRLAAALRIDLDWQATHPRGEPYIEAYHRDPDGNSHSCCTEHEKDYRRAIVRAAAELGKGMP